MRWEGGRWGSGRLQRARTPPPPPLQCRQSAGQRNPSLEPNVLLGRCGAGGKLCFARHVHERRAQKKKMAAHSWALLNSRSLPGRAGSAVAGEEGKSFSLGTKRRNLAASAGHSCPQPRAAAPPRLTRKGYRVGTTRLWRQHIHADCQIHAFAA